MCVRRLDQIAKLATEGMSHAVTLCSRAFEPSHIAPPGVLCNTQPAARLVTDAAERELSTPMPDLKLIALDAEDLSVISAHLQDAVLRVGDMVYLPKEKRFVAMANRFDWARANVVPARTAEQFLRQP